MNELKIHDPYASLDSSDMPAIVPMTGEQKLYLVTIINAVRRVIEKESTLEKEEVLFGQGEFFWPKDPKKPIKLSKSYYSKNFLINYLSLGFRRKTQSDVWYEGGFTIEPKNFPRGVYLMDFPASFFSGYVLEKAFVEDRPEESIKRVNVFQFRPKNSAHNIQLEFESREDVSSLQDKYPKSFHALGITRIGDE